MIVSKYWWRGHWRAPEAEKVTVVDATSRPSAWEKWAAERKEEAMRGEEWRAEWEAARAAAVAAVPQEPLYSVWQDKKTGWWQAGKWSISTFPAYWGQFMIFSTKPSMEVLAHGSYTAFAPTFATEAEAANWLKDYIKPPPEKRLYFDAEGNPVTQTPKEPT